MSSPIQLNKASIGFGPVVGRVDTLTDINLEVKENEFVAIIGFSGSGKSTLVSLLAGLEKPTGGEVVFNGKTNAPAGPERGVMFQSYSLMPWLSVFGNIALAAKQVFPEKSTKEIEEHVDRYIGMVNLTPARDKKPHELSGGMRQRVSLARTLCMQPKILLLDEPLSALDALTRAVLQDEILDIWQKDKRTVVLITNDVDEAILMADRIIPLTIGPEATFGKEFVVDMERPRIRQTLTEQPQYQKLKTDISTYMIGLNEEAKSSRGVMTQRFPENISPKNFRAISGRPQIGWKLSRTSPT